MINILKQFLLTSLIISASLLLSCTENEVEPNVPNANIEGYFVLNEGAWGGGNASLSYYDKTNNTVTNDVFYNANNKRNLGDQAQSMTIHNSKGYIVVQNSSKIEVISADSLTSIATISVDIESPRYFIGYSDAKGYVSDWGDGFTGSVKVINLSTNQVSKTIATGKGTNQLMINDDKLYAVNAGGFGRDNTLVIIDTNTDTVIGTIEISDNPNSLRVDADGNIWVLASGHTEYDPNDFSVIVEQSTKGSLTKLSASGEILKTFPFSDLVSPKNLEISNDGSTLYYIYNASIYEMAISSSSLPSESFINKSYYGLAIDPVDGMIIGCEATSFSSAGNIDIYSSEGSLIDSHTVGIAPNGCAFR